jgi:uncharacterized membrane protein
MIRLPWSDSSGKHTWHRRSITRTSAEISDVLAAAHGRLMLVMSSTTGSPELATVWFWLISAGILGGLLSAMFGAIDWWAIPSQTRAKTIGLWHGAGNVVVVLLFIASWWLRSEVTGYTPSSAAIALSCCAVLLALITGWLGGELVDRLGVGVDRGAHLNAPNSLSGRPATEQAAPRDSP